MAWRLASAKFTPFIGTVDSNYHGICPQCTPIECFIKGCDEISTGFIEHTVFKDYSSARKITSHRNDICLCDEHLQQVKVLNKKGCLFWVLSIPAVFFVYGSLVGWGVGCIAVAILLTSSAIAMHLHRKSFAKKHGLKKKQCYTELNISNSDRKKDAGFF